MRAAICTALAAALASTAALAGGGAVSVDLSRSAGDGAAVVAIFSQEEYREIARGAALPTRAMIQSRRTRSIEVEPDDGAASQSVAADLFEIPELDKPVICVLPPGGAGDGTLYLSLWTRTAAGQGPQYTGLEKLFPNEYAGSPQEGQSVEAGEVLCVGQPGSGFSFRARYAEGAREQVYAHFTRSPSGQMASDDVVVLGKSAGGVARAATGEYWSGIAVYTVTR